MTVLEAEQSRWTLPCALRARVLQSPDRPFVTTEYEGTETFQQCEDSAASVARLLHEAGVRAGERVAVMAPNSLPAIHAWLAINSLGAVDAMINTGYRGRSLEHALNLVQARVMLVEERFLPVLRESEAQLQHLRLVFYFRLPDFAGPAQPEPFGKLELTALSASPNGEAVDRGPSFTDIASIIFTSGTSGPAKGVLMPHAQAYALAAQTVNGLRLTTSDTYYCFHPLFHSAGKFIALYAAVLSGAHVVMDRGFRADRWLQRIREHGATVTLAHGAMLEMVFAQPPTPLDSDNKLERLLASPFPARIATGFESRFGVRGIEAWGMTEVNNPCWCSLDEPLRPGTCGRVDPQWAQVRVVDPDTDIELLPGQIGEFVVRPVRPWTMMQGYVGMPEKTVEAWRNMWFHSGDAGYVDAEGYFHFVDRLGDRIRRRAENISSYDIESAASSHPAVLECAAVGVASEYESDDDVKLYIVTREGAQLPPADMIEHLVRLLPHFMVPRYIQQVSLLPRTPTNKVRKAELRAGAEGPSWDRKAAGVSLREVAARACASTQVR